MARIRSIHPGLTSDEAYMSMSMTAKAAWTPLWMQCDDHGIFEWKPIVLKALIFPADNVDFAAVLAELERLGCVRRLDIQGRPHGVVRNFAKYQRPKNPSYRHFKAEELPTEVGSYIAVKGAATPVLPQSSPSTTEIPPQMKEEGGKREEVGEEVSRSVADATRPSADAFEEFWKAYPRREGPNPRKPAEQKFNALAKTGVDPAMMIAAVKRMATEQARDVGTRFIPQAITWLNQQRWSDHAAVAFSASAIPDKIALEDAVSIFAKTGQWSRHAPVADISQAPAELLAKHGISPDGRRLQ
ncbi:hypothetical protein ABIB94_007073 [Bradyrhizobium sp. JR7.2]|uniref:hypothetical protein n=1 Tax=Bradyrhizobium sp. JR7.2 TaxID=3156375 RepID=UPI003397A089